MKNEEHWQFRKATKEQAPASREQKLHICRQSTSHSLSRAPVGAEVGVGRVGDGEGGRRPLVRQTSWRAAGAQDADV